MSQSSCGDWYVQHMRGKLVLRGRYASERLNTSYDHDFLTLEQRVWRRWGDQVAEEMFFVTDDDDDDGI